MVDNKTVFSTVEFERWAINAKDATLSPQEKFLIESFFEKDRKTIEAGTGGGRILLALQKMGYTQLTGFDFVPQAIGLARQYDTSSTIQFDVGDATQLQYATGSFEQAIYCAQLLSMIPDEEARRCALQECYRILKPGSRVVFSVLCFESRSQSTVLSLYLNYLRYLRKVSRSSQSIQSQPWLKLGNRPNLGALTDQSPHNYWYRIDEFAEFVEDGGFKIIGMGTMAQLRKEQFFQPHEMKKREKRGFLYVVAESV